MNKNIFILTIATMFIAITVKSQITLENVYPESVAFALLEGDCYYSVDFENNQCAIYELEHSSKKSVNISVPADWYLYDVAFISSKTFNNDNLIELLAVYYRYVSLTDSTGYYEYLTEVISENGSVLLKVPGGGYSDIITTREEGIKLIVYVYDFSIYPYTYNTIVYGLPGAPPFATNEKQMIEVQDAFPNPASDVINIPYRVKNISTGELLITDMNGNIVRRIRIGNTSGQVQINTSGLAAGNYLYSIESTHQRTVAKKIIIK